MQKFSVILPAYNEEGKIERVIRDLKGTYPCSHIVVVDDGSEDETFRKARLAGCEVYRLNKNMGKGYACRFGVKKAKHERMVFFDADAQFDVRDIRRLVERLGEYDMVIGSRDFSSLPVQRRISNIFARILINSITGKKYSDVLCGFRAVRRKSFEILDLQKNRYEFESEMLIKAKKRNLKVCEVQVRVDYSDYKGMSFVQSLKLMIYLIREWFKAKVRI